MKIHPTSRYQRFLPTTLAMLSGFAAVGCDEQKIAGEAPVASEMQMLQKSEQQNQPSQTDVPEPDDWQQLGGEAIIDPAPLTIDPDDLPTEQDGDDTPTEQ